MTGSAVRPAKSDRSPVKLTRVSVKSAEKSDARYVLWDSELKGFGLRVEPTGTKTYIARYRAGGGRTGTLRQFKIGSASKLTPDEARDAAEKALARVELGQDPQADRAAKREESTIDALCDEYLKRGVAIKKVSTIKLDKIRIDRHIKPRLGKKKISDVTRDDVLRLMNDIGSGAIRSEATPRTRGGKGAASRTIGLLSGIFNYAVESGLRADNPAKGVKRFKDGKRERFLSPKELGTLGDALRAMEAEGLSPSHIAIFRLLALTGCRKDEIRCLKWSEVDSERQCLRLSDSKTGAKVVQLGAPALEAITLIKRTKSPWVFPDPRDASIPIRNLDWAWVRVRRAACLEDLRIHDLRHSFASVAVSGGAGLVLIGKLLGHADVHSTSRYSHLADDLIRAAADKFSNTIDAALTGKTKPPHPTEVA